VPTKEVNDVKLYYELHGAPDQPVLVLNNGILMNAATSWVHQTEALSAHYRVLQYDCRGQGQSDHPPQAYSMAQHAQDLAGLMTALGIESAHIAGISYGGEVAQAFALDHPDRVRSLILIDTVSQVDAPLRMVIESWIYTLEQGDPQAFFNVTVPWNFSPAFIREQTAVLELARQRYADLDFPALIRLSEAFLDLDFTERLPQIQAPTCIMVGEVDLLKGLEYAQILHQAIPQSALHVLPGAGHASCWEKPAEFNRLILEFLDRQV
jgi:3-oxoadipate enol-lactonase